MDGWCIALRKKIAQIRAGNYAFDRQMFADAPPEVALLGEDLAELAQMIEARERAHHALTLEVHHRVKNNMQIVTSLLNLQARQIKDPVARQALEQAQTRMNALALVHRLLFEHKDDNLQGKFDMATLLMALCAQLRTAHRHKAYVHLMCDVRPQLLPNAHLVPLALFVVEVVTNAYRHACPEGRDYTITIFGDGDLLRITDDGIGFDVSSEFDSMGRQLIVALAQQLNGVLDITSQKDTGQTDSGTIVTLHYPIPA